MDLGGLSELSWTEKDKYQLYVESKKYKKLVTVTIKKNKQTQIQRTNQWLPLWRTEAL